MKEEKVARPDVLSYGQGHEQGWQDGRKELITEIQAGATSVAGLIEKARTEVAREILGAEYLDIAEWVKRELSDEPYNLQTKQFIKDAILRYLQSLQNRFLKEEK